MEPGEITGEIPDRGPVKRWAKLRLWAGYIYIAYALAYSRPELPWALAGLILIITGAAIRLVASATLVKDTRLCTDGIYSVTRNPLYLGSAIVGLGFASLATSEWMLGAYVLVLVPVYAYMIFLEEGYLGKLHGSAFDEYRKRTPRFFPRLSCISLKGTIDRVKLGKSREPYSTLLFLIIAALILFIHRTWIPG
jgi:hypothetical protein